MKTMALLMLTAILGATGISGSEETGTPSQAAGPHFKLAMVTTDKYSRNEKTVFPSDFPRIFAVYQVADAAQGTKLKAVWIAEKVEGLEAKTKICLLYTSDAADDLLCVDLGGRRIIKKKKKK